MWCKIKYQNVKMLLPTLVPDFLDRPRRILMDTWHARWLLPWLSLANIRWRGGENLAPILTSSRRPQDQASEVPMCIKMHNHGCKGYIAMCTCDDVLMRIQLLLKTAELGACLLLHMASGLCNWVGGWMIRVRVAGSWKSRTRNKVHGGVTQQVPLRCYVFHREDLRSKRNAHTEYCFALITTHFAIVS